MTDKIFYICIFAAAFLLTALISRRLIPVLASHKMGQRILEIGPRWHKSKEGTPTMGGLAFMAAAAVCGAAVCVYLYITQGAETVLPFAITLVMALLSGCIGITDDLAKLKKKQNEGLSAAQKFLMQLLLSGAYLFCMGFFCGMTSELYIPFVGITLELGVWYYVITLVLICGIMNSVNLTDGIDGLAGSVTFIVAAFFSLAAFLAFSAVNLPLAAAGALAAGCAAGFLIYNIYPARVFMGDTGSLFFGALVAGCAFLADNPLIIVIAGIIYIIETASVMLQVTYFKLTGGKRLFKMSPIHHHFEKCGWREPKIVTVFCIVTVLSCAAAWFGLK